MIPIRKKVKRFFKNNFKKVVKKLETAEIRHFILLLFYIFLFFGALLRFGFRVFLRFVIQKTH
jgi:hypothetical protein